MTKGVHRYDLGRAFALGETLEIGELNETAYSNFI